MICTPACSEGEVMDRLSKVGEEFPISTIVPFKWLLFWRNPIETRVLKSTADMKTSEDDAVTSQ